MNLFFDPTVTISVLMSFGTVFFAWFRTRKQDVEDRFRTVDDRLKLGSDRMDRFDVRIARIEQSYDSLPSKDDLHAIQLSLSEMSGDVKAMRANWGGMKDTVKAFTDTVRRHEQYLLENGAKK